MTALDFQFTAPHDLLDKLRRECERLINAARCETARCTICSTWCTT